MAPQPDPTQELGTQQQGPQVLLMVEPLLENPSLSLRRLNSPGRVEMAELEEQAIQDIIQLIMDNVEGEVDLELQGNLEISSAEFNSKVESLPDDLQTAEDLFA